MGYGGSSIAIENAFRETRPFEESLASGRPRERAALEAPEAFGESLLKAEARSLLEDLDAAANRLFRYPSQKVLDDYRAAVRRVIEGAESMMELRRDYSAPSGGARTLIERTEKGLEELERVLRREGRRSRIMGITDEIKGCLLSLFA